MKTNQYLIDFYNNYDENNRLVLKHGTVEFLTTMRYIEKYIRPGARVLEIGAGTGASAIPCVTTGSAMATILNS